MGERVANAWRAAMLNLDGWSGSYVQPCWVLGETPMRYRISPRGVRSIHLAGRGRWLDYGAETLVPKHAIRFVGEPR